MVAQLSTLNSPEKTFAPISSTGRQVDRPAENTRAKVKARRRDEPTVEQPTSSKAKDKRLKRQTSFKSHKSKLEPN